MSTQSGHGESLVAILDELSDLVASARSMPMSASALVNRAEVLELIDSAKAVLPGQISQADGVIADADAVLERARREAGAIVEKAKARAEELVGEENVVKEATARAARIVAEAEETAERLARDADDYCDRRLAQFEIDLNAIGTQVAAGRARLEERARARKGGASSSGDAGTRREAGGPRGPRRAAEERPPARTPAKDRGSQSRPAPEETP